MPTKSMLMAFDEYALKMQKYTPTHCSIQWNTERKKLVYNPPLGTIRTLLWHISILLTVDFILASSGLIIISQLFGIGHKIGTVNVLIILVIEFLTGFGFLYHGIIFFYGKEFVRGWNAINSLEKQINFVGK
jgi:hypothetical protein